MANDIFLSRHIGPREHELAKMLGVIGVESSDQLIQETIPNKIRLHNDLELPEGVSEFEYLMQIKKIASKNLIYRSYIGMGYYNTILPFVIQRNILENPSWYTSYTPYQAEISQGRLEALLNYQTMITDLTGLPIANASLLDEATAAAEAMIMLHNLRTRNQVKTNANVFLVDSSVFPQTIEVMRTRAEALDIELEVIDCNKFIFSDKVFGVLVQYPNADGEILDYSQLAAQAHAAEVNVVAVADILSLALLTPPGEWGADVVVGNSQRFGVPMGYGGPHAAFFATLDKFKRSIPGRIIGVSKDVKGKQALRMALQTREQHIKREKATSNICTAQALLANMAGMYAVYHGADGIKRIAMHAHQAAAVLQNEISKLGYKALNTNFFDTIRFELPSGISASSIQQIALSKEINLRYFNDKVVGLSTDETIQKRDIEDIISIFAEALHLKASATVSDVNGFVFDKKFERTSPYLTLGVFNDFRSETEMMRYIKKLERKDISLTHSMISLGSCTMKLNAAIEMIPLSWLEFAAIHPFVPTNQADGYQQIFRELRSALSVITGFADVSLQPNSGAAGEYAGLMVIRAYHKSNNEAHRKIVLIPSSAHGTNPASAVMAGFEVVVVNCDTNGNVDVNDLKSKAEMHKDVLAGFMLTYPSTHGVFESSVIEMCEIIHQYGGQVYMDGANMNAQVGFTSPARIGADVCHLNLHKTFAIPHGGGGPGMGPIAVAKHLVPFLPSHPVIDNGRRGVPAIAAAPWGSASILIISHAYIKMLGAEGLKKSTEFAILNANYLASSLKPYFNILYTGEHGRVAHEMILDCRPLKEATGISETDIAKRLMDYGFHAPTLSFPVHGTLMVEPTESESLQELDRFLDALKSIYMEIQEVAEGKASRDNNVLKNAPHTLPVVMDSNWNYPYEREKAAFPLKWIAENKFWPTVSRIDDAYGDRNLFCSCAPIDEYRKSVYEPVVVSI